MVRIHRAEGPRWRVEVGWATEVRRVSLRSGMASGRIASESSRGRNRSVCLALAPTPVGGVAERVSSFWIPDEVVLYVGLAGSSLGRRLARYYATALGARSPHAGG